MEIPHTSLQPDILRAVIKDFVLREGTDYGSGDYSLDDKINQVIRQLERGTAQVVFDPETETCNILTSLELNK